MAKRAIDVIVAGAGLSGASCARTLADRGYRVAVVERRASVAGNAYDALDEHGVFVHTYGPHIFHTANQQVARFVQRFGAWSSYEHRVHAQTASITLELPFNLNNLSVLYDAQTAHKIEQLLVSYFAPQTSVAIQCLIDADDQRISELGRRIYAEIFEHYSLKQWGGSDNFDPSVLHRVPVRLNRDARYFTDPFQGLPVQGYTSLVHQMLDHPLISLHLNQDARSLFTVEAAALGLNPVTSQTLGVHCSPNLEVVWTGAIDELFDYRYGDLPYRSLELSFVTFPQERVQEVATINYTSSDTPHTRSTEFKLMTGQVTPTGVSTICYETPKTFDRHAGHDRFYPLVTQAAQDQYEVYQSHAQRLSNLTLVGRLATYTYLDMDKVVAAGISAGNDLADRLQKSS